MRRAVPLGVLIVTLLGAVLRFHGLGARDLWIDEVFTATVAKLPLAEALARLRDDVTPPFAYLLARAGLVLEPWLGLESALRFPSALVASLAPALMFFLARARGEKPTSALVAAALVAVSATAVEHAREARFYGIELTLALGLLLASERRPLLVPLLGAAIVLTHTLALSFVFAELVLLFRSGRKRDALVAGGALALLLLPCAFFFVKQGQTLFVDENVRHAVTGRDFEGLLREVAGEEGPTRSFTARIVFLPLLTLGLLAWRSREVQRLGLSVGLPLAVFLLLKPRQLYPRYFEFALPVAFIIIVRGARLLGRGRAFALVAGVLLASQMAPLRDSLREPDLPYSRACRALEDRVQPGDRVLVLFLGGGIGEAAAERLGFRFYAGPRLAPLVESAFEPRDAVPRRTFVLVTLKRERVESLEGATVVAPRIFFVEPLAAETPREALARAREVSARVPAVSERELERSFPR
ncbi:MAG TPA: hypothetical protein VFF73_14990 [Planctomycetota bacterium]|nr:hypothetical protein [Planctomycetota bacterium]